jgi:NTP pyrophosphatase (non-canonical NTP hydrolase)
MTDASHPTHYTPIVRLPAEVADESTPVGLKAYQEVTFKTDRLNKDGLEPPILGLFGEVGSLLSALKKKQRDLAAFDKYDAAILEELGDVLWYFTNIASRSGLDLSVLAQRAFRRLPDWDDAGGDEFGTFADIQPKSDLPVTPDEFSSRAIDLAGHVGDLAKAFRRGEFDANRDRLSGHLVEVLRATIAAADAAEVSLDDAARKNLKKIFSRWPVDRTYPPRIDSAMPKTEKLPSKLRMFVEEHTNGNKSFVIQKCNGIIVGDRLTDNKTERDDYRFHDVFHIAFAVHLGWSPVFRALFHLKRKSDGDLDENQDGARAILIEEGVATFIFGRGLERNLMEGLDHVDYDLLKSIQDFTVGYEVERCALWQWEQAILDGFAIFRELRKHRRGFVLADLDNHKLAFELGEDDA